MATKQPTQNADNTQEPRRKGRFPRWLSIVVFILALIFLIAAGIIWIWHVWGDLTNTMSAIFTALGAVFGFIALFPFFFPSRSFESSEPIPLHQPIQINNFVNQSQSMSPFESMAPVQISNHGDSRETGGQNKIATDQGLDSQQQSFSNETDKNKSLVEQNKIPGINRNDLLERLSRCPPGIFNAAIFYLRPPFGVLSGEKSAQAERAVELIEWAEHPDGPGLQVLYQVYLQAIGKKT